MTKTNNATCVALLLNCVSFQFGEATTQYSKANNFISQTRPTTFLPMIPSSTQSTSSSTDISFQEFPRKNPVKTYRYESVERNTARNVIQRTSMNLKIVKVKQILNECRSHCRSNYSQRSSSTNKYSTKPNMFDSTSGPWVIPRKFFKKSRDPPINCWESKRETQTKTHSLCDMSKVYYTIKEGIKKGGLKLIKETDTGDVYRVNAMLTVKLFKDSEQARQEFEKTEKLLEPVDYAIYKSVSVDPVIFKRKRSLGTQASESGPIGVVVPFDYTTLKHSVVVDNKHYSAFTVMKNGGKSLQLLMEKNICETTEFQLQVAQILSQISHILKGLSEKGIVHNNINLETILVDNNIINLGSFEDIGNVCNTQSNIRGTKSFSPEKFLVKTWNFTDGNVSSKYHKAMNGFGDMMRNLMENDCLTTGIARNEDVWALGITILEYCSKKFLKLQQNQFGWYAAFVEEYPKPTTEVFETYIGRYIKDCPEFVRGLLKKILTLSHKDRISAEQLSAESQQMLVKHNFDVNSYLPSLVSAHPNNMVQTHRKSTVKATGLTPQALTRTFVKSAMFPGKTPVGPSVLKPEFHRTLNIEYLKNALY